MLGSRAALEAVVARRGLCRAAVVRIGAPLTTAVPPLATWPDDLRAAVSGGEAMVRGGARFDGRPAGPLDTEALAAFLARVAGDVQAVAVTGVFSPVAPEQELAAADVARRELGAGVPLSLSHEIGSLGLLERENATVLNAALVGVAAELAAGMRRALERRAIDADVFLGQNDGTVMTLEHALRFPVLMIGSGPASAMRGAAWLSGVTGGVVVDVGGGSADVGLLIDGYPREAPPPVRVAGVRTSSRMPEVITLPFGGGTVVRPDGDGGAPVVGPANVGRSLTEAALVFGGETATLTDAAVAAGRVEVGSHGLTLRERRMLAGALDGVDAQFAHAVDRIQGSRPEVALVVVGGAGGLVPGDLPGVSEVIVPADGALANPIGLAIAPAGASGAPDLPEPLGAARPCGRGGARGGDGAGHPRGRRSRPGRRRRGRRDPARVHARPGDPHQRQGGRAADVGGPAPDRPRVATPRAGRSARRRRGSPRDERCSGGRSRARRRGRRRRPRGAGSRRADRRSRGRRR